MNTKQTGQASLSGRDHLEFLAFKLGQEEYGIDILKVQEIRGYEAPTRMVNAPASVLGVLNLRGVIVPVLDLRLKFVLNVGNRVIGMVVDAGSDVVALQREEIKPAPELSGALDAQHIIGIATIQQGGQARMLMLLDIEQLMSGADMGLVAAVAA